MGYKLTGHFSNLFSRQRGATMLEFAVVGPLVTLIGTTLLQYAFIYNAKNMVNHASFMATRAGSLGNANLSTVENAYSQALIPLYGGGRDAGELAQALAKAKTDMLGNVKIELINPTPESFADWSDPILKQKYGADAIPNNGLAYRDVSTIGAASGQNILDANLIKLKITHGYELKVPLGGAVMGRLMKWTDNHHDAFASAMYNKGRLPIVTHVTLQMQSDAVKSDNTVLVAGGGSVPTGGDNTNSDTNIPICVTVGCSVTGGDAGGGTSDGGGDSGSSNDGSDGGSAGGGGTGGGSTGDGEPGGEEPIC